MPEVEVDYVVLSNIIVDDIVLADGEQLLGVLGGAATYAAAGCRIWSERVGVVSGVGVDFDGELGDWFRCNGFDLRGLNVRHERTPRSWIRYYADGERDETPQFGAEHFRRMEPSPDDLPAGYRQARGLYIFRNHDGHFWNQWKAVRSGLGQIVVWEISAATARPDFRRRVSEILCHVDILSINRTEALTLFEADSPRLALARSLEAGARVVVLRLGAAGALASDGKTLVQVPAAHANVQDVTGGGNAFTGGFLVGYCESSGDLAIAGRYGAVSAAVAIEQYGPPARIERVTRARARQRAAQLRVESGAF